MNKILNSESVTEGHPDKICDQISDAILDAYLEQDENSRVACECFITDGVLFIGGEITSSGNVDIKDVAKKTLKKIGYTDKSSGFDVFNADIIINIVKQSDDIAVGVIKEKICAGDQGIVYGYACNETKNYMPYTIDLAHRLSRRLAYVRKHNIISGLYPDGKSQVSVAYDDKGNILNIKSIVIAAQHYSDKDLALLRYEIIQNVILHEVDKNLLTPETKIHINSTGVFSKGGPSADSGLTGRKIIVDTYGGRAKHGGGAFSGKDPSKCDRSGAYMARYIAKNIVAAGLCDECEVEMAFVIGNEEVESLYINTFSKQKVCTEAIEYAVKKVFSFKIDDIIKNLSLKKSIYSNTSVYGHFGKEDFGFSWEKTDKANQLRAEVENYIRNYL